MVATRGYQTLKNCLAAVSQAIHAATLGKTRWRNAATAAKTACGVIEAKTTLTVEIRCTIPLYDCRWSGDGFRDTCESDRRKEQKGQNLSLLEGQSA
jgi:hypothetical protein